MEKRWPLVLLGVGRLFFFQAEDGIRDLTVTGVQTCALPIFPLNAHFPAFRLPDLKGRRMALEDFCGKRVLLVHWNFECGYCQFIARDLADLGSGLEKRNVQLVLLTYGDSESNQGQAAEPGLKCPM